KFQGSVVVRRNGELLYSRNFGRADIASDRPITDHTPFKIGSLTQQFTAVAVLQLREQGKLQLDDPVRKHLPWYPQATITIRHLLTHSSGIPNYTDSLEAAGVKTGTRYKPQDIAAIFKDAALEFPPGSEFDPSNSGYFLLGMVIEQLAGVPLGEYMQKYVLGPAGMGDSRLGNQVRINGEADGLATGYIFSEDELLVPAVAYDLSVYGGAAGMVSTPTDLSRWDDALRRPGALLSQASLDEMFSPVIDTYGLGWIVLKERGQTMVGHPGGVEGFNGAIARYLGDGITVIALANTEAIDCRDVLDAVAAIAHGEQVPPFTEHEEVPVSPAMFSRYLGNFRLTPTARTRLAAVIDREALGLMDEVEIYDDDGRLFMLVPMHGAKWLHGLGEDRFFFKDQAGTIAQFGPPGAPVEWLRLWQGDLEFVLAKEKETRSDPPGQPSPAR
ncbi:MAG TPA: serine hydrolase domain-containing protein, partial [Nannocystis sp.]